MIPVRLTPYWLKRSIRLVWQQHRLHREQPKSRRRKRNMVKKRMPKYRKRIREHSQNTDTTTSSTARFFSLVHIRKWNIGGCEGRLASSNGCQI